MTSFIYTKNHLLLCDIKLCLCIYIYVTYKLPTFSNEMNRWVFFHSFKWPVSIWNLTLPFEYFTFSEYSTWPWYGELMDSLQWDKRCILHIIKTLSGYITVVYLMSTFEFFRWWWSVFQNAEDGNSNHRFRQSPVVQGHCKCPHAY